MKLLPDKYNHISSIRIKTLIYEDIIYIYDHQDKFYKTINLYDYVINSFINIFNFPAIKIDNIYYTCAYPYIISSSNLSEWNVEAATFNGNIIYNKELLLKPFVKSILNHLADNTDNVRFADQKHLNTLIHYEFNMSIDSPETAWEHFQELSKQIIDNNQNIFNVANENPVEEDFPF